MTGTAVRAAVRVGRRYAASRRIPVAVAAIAVCAAGLRIALIHRWDAYGALQLPLAFETVAAAAIAVTTTSPFGEPERVTGRSLPLLRLAATVALTATAIAALAAAGAGGDLAGGTLAVLRNVAGITGIGLLFAVVLGGRLSWAGPAGYLLPAAFALYTQWHDRGLTTPWLWPGRPPGDLGGAICAGLVFATGLALVSWRGARDPVGE